MNEKYKNKLEYSVILEQLSNYANTYLGKELCYNLEASSSKKEVLTLLRSNR